MPAPRKAPFLIGLTGSIGMGKTETAKMFAQLGLPVYDADAAVHTLYDKGGAAVPALSEMFPGAIRNGRVDREALGASVAGDAAAFDRLEAIVHPLVAKMREDFIAKAKHEGAQMVVLDIPLLFESGGDKKVDAVVVVSAPQNAQEERVLARPGMTAARLEAIRARQIPDSEKRAKADFVVDTGKGLAHAFAQVQEIVARLKKNQGPEN